jgi:hypothetical protein
MPNQYVQIEVGALVSSHNISGVTDLDNRNQEALSGALSASFAISPSSVAPPRHSPSRFPLNRPWKPGT